jgi:hypothetical protein
VVTDHGETLRHPGAPADTLRHSLVASYALVAGSYALVTSSPRGRSSTATALS